MVPVLLHDLFPVRVFPGAEIDRHEFLDPDLPVLYHPGPVPVFELHDCRPVRPGLFEPELLSPHPPGPSGGIDACFEVNDSLGHVPEDRGQRLGGDIERKFPGHGVEGEPAEPVPVGDHEISPVHPAGLVEEENGRDRDIPELFADEVFDKCHIRRKRRAYVVGLEEFDLPPVCAAGAGPANQRHVTLVAPVEVLFYRRLVYHTHMI